MWKKKKEPSPQEPWAKIFKTYGITQIPKEPPPSRENYGEILTWVSGDGWITDEHSKLALDFWMSQVPLHNHAPKDDAPAPVGLKKRKPRQMPAKHIAHRP